ncbi:hypothetical protein [Vagococcus fluvialis]|uniref:hypothetical protein n=1 Tax=Vagococcus fluvialis TaxID=2738 RepID=UPI0020335872|nr:hypothetical protein [Vagococcus fluvialis]MCM2138896.1 hypothetical protein [Vagococcus fluvialis]
MLNVTTAFNEAFKSDLREVKMRIKINDVTYMDEDIVSFNYNAGSIVGESFAIGSTFANTVRLTLCKIVEGLKQLDEVIPEMGIVLPDGSIEWVKLGTFIISEEVNPDRNENRTSLECTDKMVMLDDIYESKLKYPARIRAVALEIANLAGVEVEPVSFGRLMENTIQKPVGYTYRQALGLIAQFEAGYVCFDRNGLLAIKQLEDKNYQVTPNEYFLKGLTKNELIFRPAGIQVKVNSDTEEDKVLKIGNEKGSVIHLENKVMTDGLLKLIYDKVKSINYYPYTLKWRGNPAVEVGDWLQVTDTKGNLFKVPNLSYSFEYKGGLTATSTVETVASNEVRFGYKGILDQTVEYVENALKDVGGNLIYYGVEAPPNPKEGDTWFKYIDSDTEIWVYEKVGEPDVFDWVFKISSAVDDSIKEKIDELEQQSKDQQINIDKALSDAEKAREEAEVARQEAFDSSTIAKQAEKDALDALLKGDQNSTQITTLEGQQKLTNIKVEGNTANILNLQADSEKLSLSIGKVQADVDGMEIGATNYLPLSSGMDEASYKSFSYGGLQSKLLPDGNGIWIKKNFVTGGTRSFFSKLIKIEEKDLPANTEITLSMEISNELPIAINSSYFIRWYIKDGSFRDIPFIDLSTIGISESHRKIFATGRVPFGVDYTKNLQFSIGLSRVDDEVIIRKFQMEKANKVSDWKPSFSDLTTKSEFATFEATMQGFQTSVNSDISGLQSQQTQMAGQISSTVEKVDNLKIGVRNIAKNSDFNVYSKNGDYSFASVSSGDDWVILKPNTMYTLTACGKASQYGETRVYMQNPPEYTFSKMIIFTDKDSNSVKSITFRTDNSTTNKYSLGFYDMQRKGGAYAGWLVLSEGDRPVYDWQPAPEDNASKSEVIQLSDQITQTVNKVETVDGKVTNQQSQITQLSNDISLKVDKDNAIAQINLSPESIRLDAKFIHLSGKSLIDDAVIKTAHIDNLAVTGAKIQDATISSAKIISIVADKIITGTLTGITLTGNTINGGTINNAYFYNTGARGTVRINNGGISALEFWTEDNGAFMSENGYAILRSGGKKSSDHVFLQASTEVRATRVRTFDEYIPIKASSFYAQSSSFQGYNNTTFSTEWGYVTLRSYNNAVYLQAKTEVKATKPSDPETYVPVRASSFPSGSLERFKTNIQEYKADALELIDNSTIYTYRLKSEVKDMIDKPRIGLVIGDGYKTPKEVIDGDGVEQYAMNSISWKAIQELHRKIKRLEERLEYENIT